MGKKKIVIIAQPTGGVSEYLYMFLKNFNVTGFEIYMILSNQYKELEYQFKPFVKEIYYVEMVRNLNPKIDISGTLKIRKILKQIKPEIVYLQSSKAGGIGRLALWFNRKVKVIYNAHGWYFNAKMSKKKILLYSFIEKILARHTNMIVNISKNEYDSAIEKKIAPEKRMCIIENGIDFEKFKDSEKNIEATKQELNIVKDEKIIGVVGRLMEQKDPMTTIKAFKLVHDKNPKTKLLFVGSGDLEQEVRKFAQENNIINDIIITGWVKNVEKYIPLFDVAILPSKWEGFGLAIVEYMACHKPIIATKVGGINDLIIDDKNGYLIDIQDYETLSNKIMSLLEDEKKVKSFVDYNDKNMKKYDIKNVVNSHIELFDKLLEI